MALKEILARFGFQVDDAALKKGGKSVDGFTAKLGAAVSLYAGAQALGAIRGFFSEMTALEGQINDQSEALGISAQAIQEWGYAAKQSGASMEDVAAAIRKVQMDAGTGGAKIKEMGVALVDSSGNARSSVDVFRDVGLAIAALPNEAERTAKSMELFGKSGTRLSATFAGGAAGLEEMNKRFAELGGGIGPEALDVLSQAGDRAHDFEVASTGLKARLAVALFPAFTTLITKGGKLIGMFGKMAEGSKIFQAAAVVAALAVGRAGIKMLLPYLPMIAILAGIVLLFDEILTTLDGGDSLISRFVDSMLGIGATRDIVKTAKGDWADLMAEVDKSPDMASKVETFFGTIGASIVRFFAEDIGEAVDLFISRNPEIADAALEWTNSVLSPFDALAAAPGKVIAWGKSVLASFRAIGAEFAAWAKQAGADVVNGFIEAITGGGGGVKVAAGKMGATAIAGLRGRDGVDARSPSRKAGEAGDDTAEGFLLSLMRGVPLAESAGAMLGAASIPTPQPRSSDVRQSNTITIQQYGVRDPGQQTRSGLLSALVEDRRALLGAIG